MTVYVYLSLFSSLPQHIFGEIKFIYLGALSWLCMLSKACIFCGIGIGKKKKINVVVVVVTRSGEAGNSSKAKIQAFALLI